MPKWAKKYQRKKKFLKRKYKKKYSYHKKSKYGRKTLIKKSKVSGVRKRLNNTPELKFTQNDNSTYIISIPNSTYQFIWDSNGWVGKTLPPTAGANACILSPVNGDSENQFIGTQINALYAEVLITVTLDTTVNALFDNLSIYVVQPKIGGCRDGINYPPVPLNPFGLWDPKEYKIMYSKNMYWWTGKTVTSTSFPLAIPQKTFRFKIPLRETLEFDQSGSALDNHRFFWDRPIVIAMQSLNKALFVSRVNTKFYYKDP